MPTSTKRKAAGEGFDIHQDRSRARLTAEPGEHVRAQGDKAIGNETETECSEDEGDEEADALVAEDLEKFRTSFRGLSKRFRLIKRVGEGMQAHSLKLVPY